MKTIIQLAIVALILNGVYQSGRAYYQFYDFKDRVEEEAQRARVSTTSELHTRVLDLAAKHGIPMEWDDVRITKDPNDDVTVDFQYVDTIAFVPRMYKRDWVFDGSVSVHRMIPIRVDDQR